jgi:hypothetical protein
MKGMSVLLALSVPHEGLLVVLYVVLHALAVMWAVLVAFSVVLLLVV